MKEKVVRNEARLQTNVPKWKKNLNIFAEGTATSKKSRVNLIVSTLKIVSIFSNKTEDNLIPVSIFPLCPDKERN